MIRFKPKFEFITLTRPQTLTLNCDKKLFTSVCRTQAYRELHDEQFSELHFYPTSWGGGGVVWNQRLKNLEQYHQNTKILK